MNNESDHITSTTILTITQIFPLLTFLEVNNQTVIKP